MRGDRAGFDLWSTPFDTEITKLLNGLMFRIRWKVAGNDSGTVRHLGGHGVSDRDSLLCLLKGTDETLTVLGKAQDIANSKAPSC